MCILKEKSIYEGEGWNFGIDVQFYDIYEKVYVLFSYDFKRWIDMRKTQAKLNNQ